MIDTAAEFLPAAKNQVFALKTFEETENFSSSESDAEDSNSPIAKRESIVRGIQNVKLRHETLQDDMVSR